MSLFTPIENVYREIVADLDRDAREMLERSLAEAKAEAGKLSADVEAALTKAKADAQAAVTKYGPDVAALVQDLVQAVETALASHV